MGKLLGGIEAAGATTIDGGSAPGAAPSSNPILVSGVDGAGLKRTILTDPTGLLQTGGLTDAQLRAAAVPVSGSALVGTAPVLAPLSISGIDGAGLKRHLLTDATGVAQVSGRTAIVGVVPTTSASPAYSINDVVGGLMTFTGLIRSADLASLLQQVVVSCKTVQTAPLDLIVFHTLPAASTFTDNAALAVNVADFDKLSGIAHLTDWTNLGSVSILQADNITKPFRSAAGLLTTYAVLVTRAVMTLGSTSDLRVILKALQD